MSDRSNLWDWNVDCTMDLTRDSESGLKPRPIWANGVFWCLTPHPLHVHGVKHQTKVGSGTGHVDGKGGWRRGGDQSGMKRNGGSQRERNGAAAEE